jgi:hypothetical protein
VIRAEPPRDGFGASLRDRMERRSARTRFYSPKAVPRKEGRDLGNGFDRWLRWKEIRAGVGRKKMSPDRWSHGVSDAREETRQRALASQAAGAWWARPKRRSGERTQRRPTRDEAAAARAGANGPRGKIGLPGRNRERNEISFFSFSFSNISKHFQLILNSILNLNQTTPTKNLNATA